MVVGGASRGRGRCRGEGECLGGGGGGVRCWREYYYDIFVKFRSRI